MSNPHDLDPVVRLGTEEYEYLLARAEDHRRRAEKTTESGAKSIHLRFHQLYRDQATLLALVHSNQIERQNHQER